MSARDLATEIERRRKAEAEKEHAELEKDSMANELQRLIQQVKELEDNKQQSESIPRPASALDPPLGPTATNFSSDVYASMLENLTDTSISLSTFHGTEDGQTCADWIATVRDVQSLKGWSDEATFKRAILSLRGPAEQAVRNFRSQITNLDQLYRFLEKRFGIKNNREHFLNALTKLKQNDREKGINFLERWQKLATQCEVSLGNYFSKEQMADFLRQSLSKPFKLECKRAKAKTLEELIDCVRDADALLPHLDPSYVNLAMDSEKSILSKIDEIKQYFDEKILPGMVNQITSRPRPGEPGYFVCFWCHKPYHTWRQCIHRPPGQHPFRPRHFQQGSRARQPPARFPRRSNENFHFNSQSGRRAPPVPSRFPRQNLQPHQRNQNWNNGRQPRNFTTFSREKSQNPNRNTQQHRFQSQWRPQKRPFYSNSRFGGRANTHSVDEVNVCASYMVTSCDLGIEGKPQRAILDTGATRSLVSENLLKILRKGTDLTVKASDSILAGANGSKLDVLGEVALLLSLDRSRVLHSFVIVRSLSHSLLLGMDFLGKHLAEIDMKNGQFRVNSLSITLPLHTTRQSLSSKILPPSDLFTCSDTVLPPNSVTELAVECSAWDPLNTISRSGPVQKCSNTLHDPPFFIYEPYATLEGGTTSLSVVNTSHHPIFLAQQTPVATILTPRHPTDDKCDSFITERIDTDNDDSLQNILFCESENQVVSNLVARTDTVSSLSAAQSPRTSGASSVLLVCNVSDFHYRMSDLVPRSVVRSLNFSCENQTTASRNTAPTYSAITVNPPVRLCSDFLAASSRHSNDICCLASESHPLGSYATAESCVSLAEKAVFKSEAHMEQFGPDFPFPDLPDTEPDAYKVIFRNKNNLSERVECSVLQPPLNPLQYANSQKEEKFMDVALGENLSHMQRISLLNVLASHMQVFCRPPGPWIPAKVRPHVIRQTDNEPVRQPHRKVPFHLRDEVEKEIVKMLKRGIVRPSRSPYLQPLHVVRKASGEPRVVLDLRLQNSKVALAPSELPTVSNVLESLKNSKFLSVADGESFFNQIPLSPESCENVAFMGVTGLVEYVQ